MNNFSTLGKFILIFGIFLIIIGGFMIFLGGKLPLIGKLPGDIHMKRNHFEFYFPLTTCILISLILTLLLYIIQKIK